MDIADPELPTPCLPWRLEPRVLWLTAGAVLLYGALAAFANRAHGDAAMLRSALVQGLSCGVTTFGLSTLIDRGIAWQVRRRWPRRSSGAFAALAAMALGAGLHVAANLWAGTPELVATVALPLLALSLYCPLYAAIALKRCP
ncbi:MAG: hypothetical protein JNN03_15715 [Rubrivivax sp.]|nr:hypothetical protein [Rubrivivax sp.]